MDENNSFNMTENLDLIITLIDDLKNRYDSIKESLHNVVKLTLNSTSSAQTLNILKNDSEYRDSFMKVLHNMNNLCENDQTSDNFNRLIEIINVCKVAIPLAKNEGKEIV